MGKSKKTVDPDDERRSLIVSSALLDLCSQQPPSSVSLLWKEHVEIRKLLAEVTQIQASGGSEEEGDGRERYLEGFLTWCKSVGIQAKAVSVGKFPEYGGGYGLVSVGALEVDEPFVIVPRKAMLTFDDARKSSDLKEAISVDPILMGMSNVALSLFVLAEKFRGEESFWYPYLAFLPSVYTSTLYFTEEELKILRGSPAFEDALKIYRNIARQFAYFHQLLGSKQGGVLSKTPFNVRNFTFNRYRWAVCTVMTRINLIPSTESSNTKVPALIPFLDLANHAYGLPTTDFDEESQCAVCRGSVSYKEGEQVFMFYGQRNNADFLVHEGFVYTQNQTHDYVRVKLGLSKTDKLLAQRSSLLEIAFGLKPNEWFNVRKGSEPISEEMMAFIRVFVASEEDIEKALKTGSLIGLSSDKAIEMKVWNFIKTRLELLRKGYESVQKEENCSPRAKLAVDLMESEKAILSQAVHYAKLKSNC